MSTPLDNVMQRPVSTGARSIDKLQASRWALLAIPSAGWFLWFLLVPFVIVLLYSFATKGIYGGITWRLTPENYDRATDWLYLKIYWNSVKLAGATSFLCLLLGYPMAYAMATASARFRNVLLVLVILPFWTNLVIRAYALKVLLGMDGFMNRFLLAAGILTEPFVFEGTQLAVWFGMVTNYLPFMVLPLYVSLEKFDFSLLEAGRDLGASSWQVITRILLPLTKSGIITGFILVFTPALGEFVIPDLFGGAKVMLMGNLITEQFLKTRDWPFGSALSILIIAPILMLVFYEVRRGKS